MPDEKARASLSQRRGKLASGIKDPEKKREFIAAQGKAEAAGKNLDDLELETSRETNRQALILSYKHGGKVKDTGLAFLHKGEKVLTKAEVENENKSVADLLNDEKSAVKDYGEAALSAKTPKAANVLKRIQKEEAHHKEELKELLQEKTMHDEKKSKHARTEIEHHDDGSHTVRHHSHPDKDGKVHSKSYAASNLDDLHDRLDDNIGGEAEAEHGEAAEEAAEEQVHPGIHEEIAPLMK